MGQKDITYGGAMTERSDGKKRSQKEIDESLKRVYQDMIEDEVPDRFKDLLRQLREQDGEK
jgi:hypothetical protein